MYLKEDAENFDIDWDGLFCLFIIHDVESVEVPIVQYIPFAASPTGYLTIIH